MAQPPPLTQAQIDGSFRSSYLHLAVRYGLQYYVSGRFAVAAQLTPVSASLLHHAIELLLKACLSRDDTPARIRSYGTRSGYGHKLDRSWQEFKRRNADVDAATYDPIIAGLDPFEDIRYPDELMEQGASIIIGMVETPGSVVQLEGRPGPGYELMLPRIDTLMALLFERSGYSPAALNWEFTREPALGFLRMNNATPIF